MEGSDVRDMDKAVELTEQELKRLPVGYLTAYREMGWRTLRAGQTEAALRNLHKAVAAFPDDVRTLIGRGHARALKNLLKEAQADAEQVLVKNEFDKEAIFLQARCQYELGNFEEGLVMFHRGINKRGGRKEFQEGRQAVEASIENCVGRHAGPMMTNLQTTVRKMTLKQRRTPKTEPHQQKQNCLEELDRQPTYHCSHQEWRRLQRRREEREQRIATVYLGRLAEDRHWCQALAASSPANLRKTDIKVRELAKEALREADEMLAILRARKPLYHFQHKFQPCEALHKKQRAQLKAKKQELMHNDVQRMLRNLKRFRGQRLTKQCVNQAHKIKTLLESFDSSVTEQKLDYLKDVCETMGLVYLDRKAFRPRLSEKDNRRRVAFWLGMDAKYNDMRMDPITQRTEFPFFDYAKWLKMYKGFLAISENDLERAWLHHEVARTYVVSKKWEHLVAEANKSAACARQCGSLVWEINALFLVVVGESQRRDGGEALEVLNECLAAAHKLKDEYVLEFLGAAKQQLNEREEEAPGLDAGAIMERREEVIVRLQDDVAAKERMRDLLARIRFLPADRRMGLVPGIDVSSTSGFRSGNKSIIPGGSGGRLGLHPITDRSYYEFLEINDPFL